MRPVRDGWQTGAGRPVFPGVAGRTEVQLPAAANVLYYEAVSRRPGKSFEAVPMVARTLRAQRALRDARELARAPMPTLRQSIAYLMSTSRIADDAAGAGHRLELLGQHPGDRALYFVETMHDADTADPTLAVPLVYRMHTVGPHAGHLIPLASWYDERTIGELPSRIATLTRAVAMPAATDPEMWMLTTRVIQHRAIRLASSERAVRKFALQLTVEPGDGVGPPSRAVVTAYLRPRATLDAAWAIPNTDHAVVRITYVGVPSGLGLHKQTALLVAHRTH